MEMINYKMVLVHINESQKGRLEDFFEDIGFYYYAVQSHAERVISKSLRHKNNKIWPGTDCFFNLVIANEKLSEMLSYLKTFRMSLPRLEEHTSELQSRQYLVCRLLLEKKKN